MRTLLSVLLFLAASAISFPVIGQEKEPPMDGKQAEITTTDDGGPVVQKKATVRSGSRPSGDARPQRPGDYSGAASPPTRINGSRPSGNARPQRPGDYSGAASPPRQSGERPSGNALPQRPGDNSGATSPQNFGGQRPRNFVELRSDDEECLEDVGVEDVSVQQVGPVFRQNYSGYGSWNRPGEFNFFTRPGDFSGGSTPFRNFFPNFNRPQSYLFGSGGRGRSSRGGSSSRPSSR